MQNLKKQQAVALQIPSMEQLSGPAVAFVASIYGSGDEFPPQTNLVEPLSSFFPILTSVKLAALAESKITDSMFRLKLRYFSGLPLGHKDVEPPRGDPNTKVVQFIKRFFSKKFSNPDNDSIETCVRRARLLYITAATEKSLDNGEREETIVAAVNFASMGPYGMYVNWLATSDEPITQKKYGEKFEIEAGGGSWQHRNFAQFLLKLANLSIVQNMGKFASDLAHGEFINCVVLQARTDSVEKAHKFYRQIGFEECGFYDQDTELSKHVFKDFPDVLKLAEHSNRDFIHFIRDLEKNPDLAIFKNTTGLLVKERGRQRQLTERFRDVKFLTEPGSFSFPFSSKREHLMLLASGLDFYFLPFQNDEDINEFLQPNNMYSQHSIVTVQRRDRECLINKWLGPRYSNSSLAPSNPGWELTDPTIDFFARWYVACAQIANKRHAVVYVDSTHNFCLFYVANRFTRLAMDGSTKASQHISILPVPDVFRLSYDASTTLEDLTNRFQNCVEVVHKTKARGFFTKSWMAIPINFNNQHWGLLSILNPTFLGEDQEKMFTAYHFFDPMSPNLPRELEMETMMRTGILNFLVYANMAFGNPRILPSQDNNDISRVRNMLLDD